MAGRSEGCSRGRRGPRTLLATGVLGLVAWATCLAAVPSAGASAPAGPVPVAAHAPGDSTHAAGDSTHAPGDGAGPGTILAPPTVPAHGTYLGAWIDPRGVVPNTFNELAQLAGFVAATGFRPTILTTWTGFTARPDLISLRLLATAGAYPLISWHCGPPSEISAGKYDADITRFAEDLKSYGRPVFLRYAWEMNLRPGGKCGSGGPSAFVASWRHIHRIFRNVGATNVAFVWNPGIVGGVNSMPAYYPGSKFVDWIAADGYDRRRWGISGLSREFSDWYQTFAPYDKPMLIGETGAGPDDQAQYLAGIKTTAECLFPQVHGIVYFDAPKKSDAWQLTSAGATAFASLGADPYFRFPRARSYPGHPQRPTVTGVRPSQGTTRGGQRVTITGTGLACATTATFGTDGTVHLSLLNDTSAQLITPPGRPGPVNVSVRTWGGRSEASPANRYTYLARPSVDSVVPDVGPAAGGVRVTIHGDHLIGATGAYFGDRRGAHLRVVNDHTITVTAPPGRPGAVNVLVSGRRGTSPRTSADRFTYLARPSVEAVVPDVGPVAGGVRVTIHGDHLIGATGAYFGARRGAGLRVLNDHTITVTAPPGRPAPSTSWCRGGGVPHPAPVRTASRTSHDHPSRRWSPTWGRWPEESGSPSTAITSPGRPVRTSAPGGVHNYGW